MHIATVTGTNIARPELNSDPSPARESSRHPAPPPVSGFSSFVIRHSSFSRPTVLQATLLLALPLSAWSQEALHLDATTHEPVLTLSLANTLGHITGPLPTALLNVGTGAGTVAAGNDSRIVNAAPWITGAQLSLSGVSSQVDHGNSFGRAHSAYLTAPEWTENWASLSAWAGGNVQVSGGYLYGVSSPSGVTGVNRPLPTATPARAKIVSSIRVSSAGTDSGALTMIGLSADAAGAAPAADAVNLIMVGVLPSTNHAVFFFGVNVATGSGYTGLVDSGTVLSPGTYYTEITIDETSVCMAISDAGHNIEATITVPKSTFTTGINNVVVWNSDTRATSGGCSVGPVGLALAPVTLRSRTGFDGTSVHIVDTIDANGQAIRIQLPPNYDSLQPCPLIVYCHGAGQTSVDIGPHTALSLPMMQALNNAGYIVASSTAHGNTWGNATALNDYQTLYRYVRDHYNIGPVIIGGQSMGGIAAMNLVASRKIPGVSGIMLFEPAFSLQSMYYSPTDPYDLIPQIAAAYGITGASSGAGSYAVQTAGFDPALLSGYSFLGLPVWTTGSPSDTVVPFSANEQVLMTNLTPYAASVTYFATTGDHADPSTFATPSQASVLASLTGWLGAVAPSAPANYPAAGSVTLTASTLPGAVPSVPTLWSDGTHVYCSLGGAWKQLDN
jgi:acetyl esterase/lipase